MRELFEKYLILYISYVKHKVLGTTLPTRVFCTQSPRIAQEKSSEKLWQNPLQIGRADKVLGITSAAIVASSEGSLRLGLRDRKIPGYHLCTHDPGGEPPPPAAD